MRGLLVSLVLAAAALANDSTMPRAEVTERQEVDGVTYHIATVDPARVRVLWADDAGRPLRTFDALAKHIEAKGWKAELLMNGGIFEPGGVPSGLLIQEGKELRPVNRRDGEGNFYLKPNGVFFLTDTAAGVIDTAKWPPADRAVRSAVQSGPLLLRDGKVHPAFRKESASRLIRNGVGVTRDGKVALAMTDFDSEKLPNLFEFAMLFRKLGCDDALFLDGDLSQIRKRGEFQRPGGRFGSFVVVLAESP